MATPKNMVIISLTASETKWLEAKGLQYLSMKIKSEEPIVKPVGEISFRTLRIIQNIEESNINNLIETVQKETGVHLWGSEGNQVLRLNLDLGVRLERLKQLRQYSITWSRRLDQVVKAIILKDLGYVLYDGDLPYRNRSGIVCLRRAIRKLINENQNDIDKVDEKLLRYTNISLRLLGIPYDR